VPFWLVFLTDNEVLYCYETNVRSSTAWLSDIVCVMRILFSRLSVDASNFVRKFT